MRITVLQPKGTSPHVTKSKDLSLGGLFLEGGQGEKGSTTKVMILEDSNLFVCRARIVRRTQEGVGLEFLEPNKGFLEVVSRILNDEN